MAFERRRGSHWEVNVGSENVMGRKLALTGSMPPFLGRERAAVGVDVDPVSDPVRRARVLFATTPTQEQSLSRRRWVV